jgi:hypothetical protein
MKEINLPSGNYLFVEVPDDTTDFHYDSWFTRYINHSKGSIKLDVNTEIISTTKDITEEQASKITFDNSFTNDFYNFMYDENPDKFDSNYGLTAKESLQSLIQANGLDVNKNYLILKKL